MSCLPLSGILRCRTRSWANAVEKTSGAPSIGRASLGFSRHETRFGSTGRRGGAIDFCTEGMPMTMTDLGLLNEGAALRRRSSDALVDLGSEMSVEGKAIAGMYWYFAVWRV